MPIETWTVSVAAGEAQRESVVPSFEAGRTVVARLLAGLRDGGRMSPSSHDFAAAHLAQSTAPRAAMMGGWVFADSTLRITLTAQPALGLTLNDIQEAV